MSKLVGFKVNPPWPDSQPFVKARVGATREAAQWIIDNLNEKGYADMEILESKAGDLYLKEKWKPERAAIQTTERKDYSVSSKTDADMNDDIPWK